jgi:cardiolipin synthase
VRRPAAIRELTRSRVLRFTEGNRVTLYENGRAGLAAMLSAIQGAKRYIHLETYILRSDITGRRFLGALTERARAGVAIRLLYDAVGSRGIDPLRLEPLRRAGGDVVPYNPLLGLYPSAAPRRRDHRKILTVDGQVAFTGGLNIADEYDHGPESGENEWRDAHVQLEGPAVRDLEAVFLESWFRADGPDLPWLSFLDSPPAPCGDVRCAVLPDGPAYRRRRMRDVLISALEHAEQCVELETPYFAPGRRVLDVLGITSARGVDVQLLVTGPTDHPLLARAARWFMPRLLQRGVNVHEYSQSMMHAKVAIFDRQWAILGTSNLDRQSFEHNQEVNLILEGGDIGKRLAEHFERNMAHARQVDLAALGARGWRERLVDRACSFLLYFV